MVLDSALERQPDQGLGSGWLRLAALVADRVPPSEIDAIWVFPAVYRDGREWGTAVISHRVAHDRIRIYTAQFMRVTRGRERGQERAEVREVGAGPAELIHQIMIGVQQRSGDGDPAVSVSPSLWYQEANDQSATQG